MDLEGVFAILCIFVILPGMVLYFIDRRAGHRTGAAPASPAAQGDLQRVAERMEQRIEALEKILDVEAPDWRKRDAE